MDRMTENRCAPDVEQWCNGKGSSKLEVSSKVSIAEDLLRRMLGKRMRLLLDDGRIYEGTCICIDAAGNLLMSHSVFLQKPKSSTSENENSSLDDSDKHQNDDLHHTATTLLLPDELTLSEYRRLTVGSILIMRSRVKNVQIAMSEVDHNSLLETYSQLS